MGWRTDYRYDEDRRAQERAMVASWPRWKRVAWRLYSFALIVLAIALTSAFFWTVWRAT